MFRLPRMVLLVLIGLALASCTMPTALPTASDALSNDPQLSELTQALTDANLVAAIEGSASVTIFAPTDAAFAAMAAQQGGVSTADLLRYHVIASSQSSADLADGQVFGTLYANSTLGIDIDGGVKVVDGGSSATVVTADIEIANGVIHKIDAVLTPPEPTATVATNAGLTALVDALVAANLAGEFDEPSDGPYTVFAPSDAAFGSLLSALGFADLNALVASYGVAQTAEILQLHVVSGIVGRADVVATIGGSGTVETLLGVDISLSADASGNVIIANPNGVADAMVTATNIVTANGVVHLIDAVLVPTLDGPTEATYALTATGAGGTDVSGSVTLTKIDDATTEITIDVTGTPAGGNHPAHIHTGDITPGGGIYVSLNNVNGDTGTSTTQVTQTDAGDPITFEQLIAFDGYVNVHLSPQDFTVVSNGETGAGATIVAP